jgi:hypothetical protein
LEDLKREVSQLLCLVWMKGSPPIFLVLVGVRWIQHRKLTCFVCIVYVRVCVWNPILVTSIFELIIGNCGK